MTASEAKPTQAPVIPNWLRVILLIVAIGKVVTSVTALSILFDDDPSIPGQSLGGLAISATIAVSPILAIIAFVCALRGRTSGAIIAIAGLALLDWLSYVPSVANHWSEFPDPGFVGAVEILQIVVLPLLAAVAIVLAWRGERLVLAAALAILPTLVFILGVVAFGIGVALYGF
jgi:hypothetical protein